MKEVQIGDCVTINDHSEAQGYPGKVFDIHENGLVLIDIGDCLWPVYKHEIVLQSEEQAVKSEKEEREADDAFMRGL